MSTRAKKRVNKALRDGSFNPQRIGRAFPKRYTAADQFIDATANPRALAVSVAMLATGFGRTRGER